MSTQNFTTISWHSIARIAMALGLGFAIWKVGSILVAILTAVVVASFVDSIVDRMVRFKIPRFLGVVLVYILMFATMGGLLFFFVPQFLQEVGNLLINTSTDTPEFYEFVLNFKDFGATGGTNISEIFTSLQGSLSAISGGALKTLSGIFGGALSVILIVVISFYLAIEEKGVARFFRAITPARDEDYVLSLWNRTKVKIGAWFQGQLLQAFILGVLTYIGLWAIGVPYALMLGLLAAVMGLVPFGILFAGIIALVSALSAGGLPLMLWTLGLYALLQQIENYVLQPLIIRQVTGVPSVIVLLSVIIGASLFGIMGLLLAIPLAVLGLEVVSDFQKSKNLGRTKTSS